MFEIFEAHGCIYRINKTNGNTDRLINDIWVRVPEGKVPQLIKG